MTENWFSIFRSRPDRAQAQPQDRCPGKVAIYQVPLTLVNLNYSYQLETDFVMWQDRTDGTGNLCVYLVGTLHPLGRRWEVLSEKAYTLRKFRQKLPHWSESWSQCTQKHQCCLKEMVCVCIILSEVPVHFVHLKV